MMMKKHILLIGFLGLFCAIFLVAWRAPSVTTFTIKGKVVDAETGEALPLATLVIPGKDIKTEADFDGLYTFENLEKCVQVQASYSGYQKYTSTQICSDTTLVIQLKPGVVLDEVAIEHKQSQPLGASRVDYYKDNATKSERRDRRSKNKAKAMISGQAMSVMPAPSQARRKPVDHNTEDYSTINENRFVRPLNTPLSTFSIDVDAASYSNLRRFLNEGQMPPKDAVRIEEMVNYFDYDYPAPQGYEPFTVSTEIGPCPWQKKHRLLHIGLQGKRMPTAQLPNSNLVFLLDVSGSMNAANKLPLLKESLKMLVDNLRPEDKVAIVVYAGAAGVVLPATKGTDKQAIKEALQNLEAGGSTAGGAGIKLAYKIARENLIEGGNNRIILATDGDFNVGASSDAEMVRLIEKERESGVFLTVLGFGMGNYKDNKMQQLADKGNGNHAYIDNLKEAKKVLVNEFGGTLFTIAKDVKLQIEFNPTKVAGYRLIGYENRLLNDEDFDDDTKDAGELGAGHTVTALYEIIPAGTESEFLVDQGDLKYQKSQVKNYSGDELSTIKLRYKQPDGDKSQLLEKVVMDTAETTASVSENFQWSAATAVFGMLLRDSEFKGEATFEQCRTLAEKAKGKDSNGYRAEMISLIEKAGKLNTELVVEK